MLWPAGLHAGRPASDDLVLHFPFDADEAETITDQSGYGNDGIVLGARYTPAGTRGGAYEFDGRSYIRVPASASLHLLDQFAVSVFFHPYDYNDQRPLVSWVSVDGTRVSYGPQVWLNVHGYQWRGLGTGAHLIGADLNQHRLERVISFANPPPRQWHHMVVTYDRPSGTGRLYINGTQVKTQQMQSYDLATDSDVMIGAGFIETYGEPQPYFHGLIDDVRIYNRVLTETDVAEIIQGSSIQTAHATSQQSAHTVPRSTPYAPREIDGTEHGREPGTTRPAPPAAGHVATTVVPRHVTYIGFSNDPDGEEDVTHFHLDETLYVRVQDVSLEGMGTNAGVRVILYQAPQPTIEWDLEMAGDGWYTGTQPLATFHPGRVYVSVMAWHEYGISLRKDLELFIDP